MQLGKISEYEFIAEPFHCDFSHQLMLGHLGNSMLNTADYHSNERGYGMEYLNTVHRTWVLSRLAIEMEHMPKSYDKFKIATWVESAMRFFTSRNFAVITADGQALGYGRSIWAMIDTNTRQPVDILAVRDGLIAEYIETNKSCPICKSSRVKIDGEVKLVRSIPTYYNDVDVNGHINSVKYIEHVLDLFDINFYKTHRLKRIDVAYIAESHQGDLLNFYVLQSGDTYTIRITKSSCMATEEIEVVSVLLTFIKD